MDITIHSTFLPHDDPDEERRMIVEMMANQVG